MTGAVCAILKEPDMSRLETRVPPPVLALIIAIVIWGLSRIVPDPALPAAVSAWASAGLFLLAVVFGFPAIAAFVRAGTTIDPVRIDRASVLVTGGLYRITRNPMYVGLTLLLAAWAAFLGPLGGFAGVIGFALWIDRLQIRAEERLLTTKFGADYAAYRSRVRRWL